MPLCPNAPATSSPVHHQYNPLDLHHSCFVEQYSQQDILANGHSSQVEGWEMPKKQ
jgi:hypothetical protein